MTKISRPSRRIVASAVVGGVLVLAACGGDADEPAPANQPTDTEMTEDSMMTEDSVMSEDSMMTEATMMDEEMTDTTSAP